MTEDERIAAFRRELRALLNRWSVENLSNTPDHILAEYLIGCLATWAMAVNDREAWYGRSAQGRLYTGGPDA